MKSISLLLAASVISASMLLACSGGSPTTDLPQPGDNGFYSQRSSSSSGSGSQGKSNNSNASSSSSSSSGSSGGSGTSNPTSGGQPDQSGPSTPSTTPASGSGSGTGTGGGKGTGTGTGTGTTNTAPAGSCANPKCVCDPNNDSCGCKATDSGGNAIFMGCQDGACECVDADGNDLNDFNANSTDVSSAQDAFKQCPCN